MNRRHLAVLTLIATVLLSGCAGTRPNVAVQVDNESVSLSTVDELTNIACAPENYAVLVQSQTQLPRSVIRTSLASLAGLNAAVDAFIADQGLDDSALVNQQRAAIVGQLTETMGAEDSEKVADLLVAQSRYSSVVQSVGANTWRAWLAAQDIHVDPRLSLNLVDAGNPPRIGSLPISEFAKGAADTQNPSIKGLSANQLCG